MSNKFLPAVLIAAALPLHAGILQRGKVQLMCHRTANRDMPENTLESLALAARMGCNVVEVDVRTTADGVLVLNHDGYLERLTDGMGDVESTTFEELQLLDYGDWMAPRFGPMRIPRFTDALRLARELGIGLALDIKQKGEGAAILAALRSEGMTDRVTFGGDDGNADDLRAIFIEGNSDAVTWLGPEPTAAQVDALHAKGRFVVANFSVTPHDMDLPAMRAAVAAGVDAINVDYPRLGADAIGRPVEAKLAALAATASAGPVEKRTGAIREISRYVGFPTQPLFSRLLRDPEADVSRAAALALLAARPAVNKRVFVDALSAAQISTRKNAAWALGMLHAPAIASLLPLLKQSDPTEQKEVLLAISRCPGTVTAQTLLPFLSSDVPTVRAAAALALTRHQPEVAAHAVPALLRKDEQRSAQDYEQYMKRGKPKLTQAEIDPIIEEYREHMKLVHALELLPQPQALPLLATEAFRTAQDSSHVTSLLAGYGLWDRIQTDPALAIKELDSAEMEVANRAEWILVKAGVSVLPAVRAALAKASPAVRVRLIHIVAWQGDAAALPLLRDLHPSNSQDHEVIVWALQKIQTLRFEP